MKLRLTVKFRAFGVTWKTWSGEVPVMPLLDAVFSKLPFVLRQVVMAGISHYADSVEMQTVFNERGFKLDVIPGELVFGSLMNNMVQDTYSFSVERAFVEATSTLKSSGVSLTGVLQDGLDAASKGQ